MHRKYRGMFSRDLSDLSVDLGNDNTLLYVKDKGMVSVAELRNGSRSQQTDAVNKEVDVQLEKMVETFDTYIPVND